MGNLHPGRKLKLIRPTFERARVPEVAVEPSVVLCDIVPGIKGEDIVARIISDLAPEMVQQRRIAACLRACEGIPTEALEEGIILRLVAACVHIEDARVREVLEKLSALRPRLVRGPTPKRDSKRPTAGTTPNR